MANIYAKRCFLRLYPHFVSLKAIKILKNFRNFPNLKFHYIKKISYVEFHNNRSLGLTDTDIDLLSMEI